MVTGGYIKGEEFAIGEKDNERHWMAAVWGMLTRDAKLTCIRKPKVEICIRFRRGVFINCIVWGDNPCYRLATTLKEGDFVAVLGDWKEKGFNTKEGYKTYYDLRVDALIPMPTLCAMAEMTEDDLPPDRLENIEDEYDDTDGVPGF